MTAKEWNAIHPVGSRVHYYPHCSDDPATPPEHNAFYIDTRTTAKAFDGPCGPIVRINHYGSTVSVDRLHVVSAPAYRPNDFIMNNRRGFPGGAE